MNYSPQTLYFDIKRRTGLLFIELRVRETNRLLDPDEALKVAELPDGFTLTPNPETPGKAAFTSKVHKGPMMTKVMQDAGFRYDAEDVKKFGDREIERAEEAKKKAAAEAAMAAMMSQLQSQLDAEEPGSKVTDIKQNESGMVIATVQRPEQAPPEPEALADFEAIRFNVGTRMERQTVGPDLEVVRVAIEMQDEEGEWHGSDYEEFSDLPDFLVSDNSRVFESTLGEAETVAALAALGWTHEPRVFLWYMPHELAFGIQIDAEDPENPKPEDIHVFVMPIEEKLDLIYDWAPYEDDLRGDALGVDPDFFGDDVMENTFELREPLEIEEIKRRMIALGYTHDPELDEIA